ncbi:regulatory protein RecX [Naasia lichenicola]|uniref:Regulatory protein RecX n=1 Tax=Naasia lichenicola TaxID=2565933 RepID=A0A4S4FS44_9MICO|nr:regulatory protein RecX [Naasia lichenicola]THG32286.1 regulatory protein RecX [Naasia lichenicola]
MSEGQELAPVIPLFGTRSAEPEDGGELPAAPDGVPVRPRLTVVAPVPADTSSDHVEPADPMSAIARMSRTMFSSNDSDPDADPDAGSVREADVDDEADETSSSRPTKDIRVVSQSALARRGLSVKELSDKLTTTGYPEDDVLAEIDRLSDLHYLDDRRLAEEVVRVESERKGKGRSAVMTELRRRGIAAEDYLEALDVLERDSERERATEIAEKRIRQLSGYDDATVRRRLHSFLSRRGFGGDTVGAAVDAAMHPHR